MSYMPNRAFPVAVQLRNAMEYAAGLRAATGSITFNSVPDNADFYLYP